MASIEKAPEMAVLTDDGNRVRLSSLFSLRPLALVFLRHLGCAFCSEHATALAGEKDLNLAFVCMSEPGEALAYKKKKGISQRFICDAGEDLYREFGLDEGRRDQLISMRVISRGASAMVRGHINRRSAANMRRLGGSFVICTDGRIAWSHKARDAADLAAGTQIRQALCLCGEKS